MIKIAFNLSDSLRNNLQRLEVLRHEILVTPISPKSELRYQWDTHVSKIYWALILARLSVTKKIIIQTLSQTTGKKISGTEKEILNYRRGIYYVKENWLVSTKKITINTVRTIHDIVCTGRHKIESPELLTLLDYIEIRKEHPCVEAAIIKGKTYQIWSDFSCQEQLSNILSYIYLYRVGYDFRGLLTIEEFFGHDQATYRKKIDEVIIKDVLTPFIEFYAQGVVTQLQKIRDDIKSEQIHADLPAKFWELNDRQKEILRELDNPEKIITNRQVQKIYKVSQITAARDLAKLVVLGLIYSHGKGRSTYYTKV